ncbi:bacterial proteasome activator family protein [Nocardia bovistercoris]|uniref:Bacterial proteasome activator n=1 Tax=Nocardia bovistercoris TaxID=2785916 RepID=A0A931ICS6_9NOCA|nr:bacterial proteasome activator family protein [Nocardia bovistercoris]MBH0779039.1 bacterial proteasome activator family protein [Nocardia bovistercoris]
MTHSDEAPDSIVVVGPDGRPLIIPADAATPLSGQVLADRANSSDDDNDEAGESLADMVEQPAKVMRIGTMIKQLLEEVRAAPLDDASRTRLREIHKSSVRELEQGLAPELRAELERLTLPFTDDAVPSDAELRIAQAQLVGWLEGLFHGIQTALFAQQMAARAQLEQIRQGALPPGIHTVDPRGGRGDHVTGGSGQYL